MKYKQMVLLEDLVNHFYREGSYRFSFQLDNKLCTGDFRKTGKSLAAEETAVIHSEKLLNDYKAYTLADMQTNEYVHGLFEHLQGDVDYKKEKLENFIFNSMVIFLAVEETDPDEYLVGYDGPETIYNFYTRSDYREEFLLEGAAVNPLSLFGTTEKEFRREFYLSKDAAAFN